MTYFDLYDEGRIKLFKLQGGEEDARQLLLFSFGIDMNELLMNYTSELPDSAKEKIDLYHEYLERRINHEPLQYITHQQNFYGYDLYVDENVLVPRQDTECLVDKIIELEKADSEKPSGKTTEEKTVLDMCTGSGCIAIALAGEGFKVTGSDISRKALEVADKNATENGMNIDFYESDMFSHIPADAKFDIIVSNPPYIESDVIPTLMSEVAEHEPMLALDGDKDGLKFYRILAGEAPKHFNAGGRIYLEIGYNQAEAVSKLLADAGFTDIHTYQDLAKLDRIITAKN